MSAEMESPESPSPIPQSPGSVGEPDFFSPLVQEQEFGLNEHDTHPESDIANSNLSEIAKQDGIILAQSFDANASADYSPALMIKEDTLNSTVESADGVETRIKGDLHDEDYKSTWNTKAAGVACSSEDSSGNAGTVSESQKYAVTPSTGLKQESLAVNGDQRLSPSAQPTTTAADPMSLLAAATISAPPTSIVFAPQAPMVSTAQVTMPPSVNVLPPVHITPKLPEGLSFAHLLKPNYQDHPGRMFVGGIRRETTAETLKTYFKKFGEVLESFVMINPADGMSRGFGFITYADPASIEAVLMSGPHIVDGKMVDPKPNSKEEQRRKGLERILAAADNKRRLFIGGLPAEMTDEKFKEFFQNFGEVVDGRVVIDEHSKRSRGFGFVTFKDDNITCELLRVRYFSIWGRTVEAKLADRDEYARFQKGLSTFVKPLTSTGATVAASTAVTTGATAHNPFVPAVPPPAFTMPPPQRPAVYSGALTSATATAKAPAIATGVIRTTVASPDQPASKRTRFDEGPVGALVTVNSGCAPYVPQAAGTTYAAQAQRTPAAPAAATSAYNAATPAAYDYSQLYGGTTQSATGATSQQDMMASMMSMMQQMGSGQSPNIQQMQQMMSSFNSMTGGAMQTMLMSNMMQTMYQMMLAMMSKMFASSMGAYSYDPTAAATANSSVSAASASQGTQQQQQQQQQQMMKTMMDMMKQFQQPGGSNSY